MKLMTSYINYTIGQYIIEPIKRKLKKWIRPYLKIKININDLIHENPKFSLCYHKSSLELIFKKYPDKIYWGVLSKAKSKWSYRLLKNNINKIHWDVLCKSPTKYAREIIKENMNKTCYYLLENPSKWAYKLTLTKSYNVKTVVKYWYYMSANSSNRAIKLLQDNQDKIDWVELCMNSNKKIIDILNKNINKMDYFWILYLNQSAWIYNFWKNNMNIIKNKSLNAGNIINHRFYVNDDTRKYYKLFDIILHKKLM